MGKIVIKDLEVFAYHGVFKEEKNLGQKFLISLEIFLDIRVVAKTCDLTKSIHYGELCHKIEREFKKESYDLIETASEKICEYLLKEYPIIEKVRVKLKKPWAPIHRSLDTVWIEIERKWSSAFIAYGSNLGNREENINKALYIMNSIEDIKITKKSKLIETKPWGYVEQDDFLNGVCEIKTILTPKELMKFLLEVENQLKRERKIKWGPRTIDLDIIFYNDLITESQDVILPHPRMHEREFVLKPLNEIAMYKIHPLYNKRVFELLREIEKKE